MVLCHVDLHRSHIYGPFLARIGKSSVEDGSDAGKDQENSGDFHAFPISPAPAAGSHFSFRCPGLLQLPSTCDSRHGKLSDACRQPLHLRSFHAEEAI